MLFRISAGKSRKRKGVILVKFDGAVSSTITQMLPRMEEYDIKQGQVSILTRDKLMCVAPSVEKKDKPAEGLIGSLLFRCCAP